VQRFKALLGRCRFGAFLEAGDAEKLLDGLLQALLPVSEVIVNDVRVLGSESIGKVETQPITGE
jgi:hypothetical protein